MAKNMSINQLVFLAFCSNSITKYRPIKLQLCKLQYLTTVNDTSLEHCCLISHKRQRLFMSHNDDGFSKTNVESLTLRPNCAVFYAANSCLINTASSYETIPVGIPRHLSFHAVILTKTRYHKTVELFNSSKSAGDHLASSHPRTHVRYRLTESALFS